MSSWSDLLEFDQEHIWHPYSSLPGKQALPAIVEAQGVLLTTQTGEQLIDGMSSWWSAIHGYNVPEINAAAKQQIDQLSHIMFGGLTHKPAIELCQTLHTLTPPTLDKIFISDSGSVAVEVAIKMAIQYWQAKGKKKKNRLMTALGGYHGDTLGTMAVCDPVNGMHHLFAQSLNKHFFTQRPHCEFSQACGSQELARLRKFFIAHHQDCAAFIIEPIVQGAGGMHFYGGDYLKALRALCDEFDVLLILDEIATGFGRTGKLFACEHAGITPDILCLGKAMTGGYISLAATLTSKQVAETICQGEAGVFMHGPTFMGNPLACSIANASLKLLTNSPWQERVSNIEQHLITHLDSVRDLNGVKELRCLGAIAVIELEQAVNMAVLQPMLITAGIWVRPFGKLLYIMPAFIISHAELTTLCHRLVETLARYLETGQ